MRSIIVPLVHATACCALLSLATCSSPHHGEASAEHAEAKEVEIDVREVAPEAKVRLLDALHAALAARPGEAVEAELEGEMEEGKREVAFEVAIVDASGVAWTVVVDPASGAVRSVAKEDDADEMKEIAEKHAAAGREHLKLGGLLERAMKEVPQAQPVKITFSGDKAPGKARAKLLRGRDVIRMTLDGRTGAVLDTTTGDQDTR